MDSLVGGATRVDGHLLFRGGLRIDGEVRGNVVALPEQPGYLVLGASGRIEGEVRCDHVVVDGEIIGAVYSAELLEILPRGRICGDIFYKVLEMHGGASVSGRLHHGAESVLHLAVSEA